MHQVQAYVSARGGLMTLLCSLHRQSSISLLCHHKTAMFYNVDLFPALRGGRGLTNFRRLGRSCITINWRMLITGGVSSMSMVHCDEDSPGLFTWRSFPFNVRLCSHPTATVRTGSETLT